MNIFSFTAHFGSEEDCRLHFKEQRDKEGVVCKRCGGTSHYWLQGKWSYECKGCRFRTSLRSGTIMESSKLPFLVVQNDVPDELHKKGILHQRTPEAIRIEALRTGMGDGTQTPQGDGQPGCKVNTGRDDRTG